MASSISVVAISFQQVNHYNLTVNSSNTQAASSVDPSSLLTLSMIQTGISSEMKLAHEAGRYFNATSLALPILHAFDEVSTFSSFDSAVSSNGSGAFTWGLAYNIKDPSSSTVGFTISWSRANYSFSETYTAFPANGTVSGPSIQKYLAARASSHQSGNWAGFEFWIPGSGGNQLLDEVDGAGTMPYFVLPTSTYGAPFISNAWWVGADQNTQGSPSLYQTGAYSEWQNTPSGYAPTASYDLFYEITPTTLYQYPASACSPYGYTMTAPGDAIEFYVFETSTLVTFMVFDNTLNSYCATNSYNVGSWYYGTYIMEALGYTSNQIRYNSEIGTFGYTGNLASFSSPIMCTMSNYCPSLNSLITGNSYNSYTLYCSPTTDASPSTGSQWPGYPQVAYLSSYWFQGC